MQLQPYLMFPGTCRQALGFYAEVFGGEIVHLQTVGESPLPAPPEHADRVFNALLAAGPLRVRASDGEPGKDPRAGENFALFVTCADEAEQERVFTALSAQGQVIMPLATGCGMVQDRFQVRWMVVSESATREDS